LSRPVSLMISFKSSFIFYLSFPLFSWTGKNGRCLSRIHLPSCVPHFTNPPGHCYGNRCRNNSNLLLDIKMFVYLSKKIAIPNNIPLTCIAWDKENGYLACGGENGLLRIVRLDSNSAPTSNNGQPQASNLSVNQTLEGHTDTVKIAIWNETGQKLTTSDQNGLIIVWVLVKGCKRNP